MTVHKDGAQAHVKINLTNAGTALDETKSRRKDRPFCIRVDEKTEEGSTRKHIFDTLNASDHQAWLAALSTAAGVEAVKAAAVFREFSFAISLEEDKLQTFTVRYSAAKLVHEQLRLAAATNLGAFPDVKFKD